MTAPYRFVFSLVSGKGWWKEMVGDAVFGGHPTSIQVFVNKTWKIYIYIYNSIQWYARFGRFTFWQYDLFYFLLPGSVFFRMVLFFSSHEKSYDCQLIWFLTCFYIHIQSNVQVCCVMRDGFRDTIFGSQSDAPVTNEAAVISMIWIERNVCLSWCGKKRPTQRPKDVLFKSV